MFVLGLQGSPRKGGNTSILLKAFLDEAERLGAHIYSLEVADKNIHPCLECGVCEREGYCPLDDGMQEVYHLLWRADVIVMATPVFFYGVPAQLKALIDRSQALWSRRYIHKLVDPGRKWRKGFMLSIGATKGGNLFSGVNLTTKYFFDAVGARFDGSLTYKEIEEPGDITKHPRALMDARVEAGKIVEPFLNRKKILFLCRENACRSQMASAFAQFYAGDRIETESAGSGPAEEINKLMIQVMAEKGIDMGFRRTKSMADALHSSKPDRVITMGCGEECPVLPGVIVQDWGISDPGGKSLDFMRETRDEIEEKVKKLIKKL